MTKVEERREQCAVYRKTVDELEDTVYNKGNGLVEHVTKIRVDMGTIKLTNKIIIAMSSTLLIAMAKIVFFGK